MRQIYTDKKLYGLDIVLLKYQEEVINIELKKLNREAMWILYVFQTNYLHDQEGLFYVNSLFWPVEDLV